MWKGGRRRLTVMATKQKLLVTITWRSEDELIHHELVKL